MSNKSKLSTLLQYRFVKKRVEKISVESRDDEKTSTEESDNSQESQNGSGILTDNNVDIPTISLKYEDSCTSTPTVNGDSQTTIPETPVSETPSSPCSSVFQQKQKFRQENVIESDEEVNSSADWMSKDKGIVMNGNCKGHSSKRKQKLVNRDIDESSDDEDLDGIQTDKVRQIKDMFPAAESKVVVAVLRQKDWNVEETIDVFISGKVQKILNQPVKKKRVVRLASSDSEMPELAPPKKRARIVQSTDSENMDSQTTVTCSQTADSQATVDYDIEDQQTNTQDDKTKIKFLTEAYPEKSKKSLKKLLSRNDWSLEKCTEILEETEKRKNHGDYADALDDEGEDYDSDAGADSEDSIDEEDTGERAIILSFFEDSTLEELSCMPGVSKKKAELIMALKPFMSWNNLVEKFTTAKGLSSDVVHSCHEIIRVRNVVIKLMEKCERISKEMENVVSYLTNKGDMVDDDGDDIQIKKQPGNLNPSHQLKPFQMVGLNWLRIMHTQHLNGILADEMGLGKTIQTIAFLAHLLEEGETGPHVIIVPSSTIDNWLRELHTWCPALKPLIYYGSMDDRRSVRQSLLYDNYDDYNVIVTTYNMATGNVEDRALFKKLDFHYAIFDEGHMLKNMSSMRYQNLMKIQAERRLLLTGTPLQNNLLELMSLLCFVMPEIFSGKTEHLKKMFSLITRSGDEKSKYSAERIAHAKRIMKPFVLRRLKSEVQRQLPKKSEELIRCEMTNDQKENYDYLVKNFSQRIKEEGNDIMKAGGASMLMQLRKMANHPLLLRNHFTNEKLHIMSKLIAKEPSHIERGALPNLIFEDMTVMHDFEIMNLCDHYKNYIGKFQLDKSMIGQSGKFIKLKELLQDQREKGEKVLIFSQFTMIMDIMEKFLKQLNYKYLRMDGQTPVTERQDLIDKFSNDDSLFIFMLSTRAGGMGINLTAASTVILHDIDFNPYNDKQAEDRCHRVGQTREVTVIRLISDHTIEEAMLRCAQEKLKLEKDITTDEGSDTDNPNDVASLLKQALIDGTV